MGNFKLGFVVLTEQSPSLLVRTPPPASREVSLRVGHNAALPATGGHSLPRCRFATPPGGSLFPNPAEILCPISGFCPRSLGSLREGAPARRRVKEYACITVFTF